MKNKTSNPKTIQPSSKTQQDTAASESFQDARQSSGLCIRLDKTKSEDPSHETCKTKSE